MADFKFTKIKKGMAVFIFILIGVLYAIEAKAEEETVITGVITPSIIAEDKDIANVEMNKIIFPLDNTNTETLTEKVEEQIYTLEVKGKGGLYLALASTDKVSFKTLKLQVYSNASMTKKVGKTYTVKQNTKVIDNQAYYLAKAGTYYLKFTYTKEAEALEEGAVEESKTFAMTAAFMYSTNRTLQEGNHIVSYADEKKRAVYYKIKVKKDGLISYTAVPENEKDLLSGHIQLCDKNKQPLSVSEYVSGSEDNNNAVHTYYAVEKGTYYIRAELNSSYIASFTSEKVKDISGSRMKNAKLLKFGGKERKSVIYLSDNEKTEKWYCFRLEKNQNFSIVLNSCINGYLNIEVYNEDKVMVKSGSVNFYTGTKILKTSAKWQKGLYYIKISKEKKSLKSSGYFSIKLEEE